MKSIHLDQLIQVTKGQLLSRHQEVFDGVGTDTRKSLTGQIFIALKGDSFDAHQFLDKAIENGAAALIIHQLPAAVEKFQQQVTIIQVPDTLQALQDLAHYSRHQSQAQFVGIAGSNGKTTSKEFCAALLSSVRQVHYSQGSFNNHWGVPFTILAEPAETEICIVEMGMNHEGELAALAKIADVDVAVCTYVGVEHIEYFGSLEKIALAEEEIYENSPAAAQRIYNLDNVFTEKMYQKAKNLFPQSKLWTFSQNFEKADVSLAIESITMSQMKIKGRIGSIRSETSIPVFGAHNITNVMVAATVGLACGLEESQIWAALPRLKTNWGRNQLVQTAVGAEILFDAYNANPDSVKALIDNMKLLTTQGHILGVFGEMRELGALSAQLHQEVGEYIGKANFHSLLFFGEHFEDFKRGVLKANPKLEIHGSEVYDETLSQKLAKKLKKQDIILVKASRGVQLERFVLACQPLDFKSK